MYNPPHPGTIIKEELIIPLGLTVTKAAAALNITRQALSELLNCRTNISTEMAIRIGKAFNTSPEMWLNMQLKYNLYHAENQNRVKVENLYENQLQTA
jgi:addiction module HigA family antidote